VVSTVGASDDEGNRDDSRSRTVDSAVETISRSPTILKLLGLDPKQTAAVQIERNGCPTPGLGSGAAGTVDPGQAAG
jgi:hypothetical protein